MKNYNETLKKFEETKNEVVEALQVEINRLQKVVDDAKAELDQHKAQLRSLVGTPSVAQISTKIVELLKIKKGEKLDAGSLTTAVEYDGNESVATLLKSAIEKGEVGFEGERRGRKYFAK